MVLYSKLITEVATEIPLCLSISVKFMEKKEKYPDIVYKYRNWSEDNHKNVLYKNQLFLTSPKDFNDPFDCRIPQNFSLLNTKEKIQQFVDKSIVRQSVSLLK